MANRVKTTSLISEEFERAGSQKLPVRFVFTEQFRTVAPPVPSLWCLYMLLYWRLFVFKSTRILSLPFFFAKVCAGFPLFVEEHSKAIDLNEHLVEHPPSTFIIQVMGDSMIDEKIFPGDLLVVDRQAEVRTGNVVVAVIDGQFCLKKYVRQNGHAYLTTGNSEYPEFQIGSDQEVEIWGVVAWSLKKHK